MIFTSEHLSNFLKWNVYIFSNKIDKEYDNINLSNLGTCYKIEKLFNDIDKGITDDIYANPDAITFEADIFDIAKIMKIDLIKDIIISKEI